MPRVSGTYTALAAEHSERQRRRQQQQRPRRKVVILGGILGDLCLLLVARLFRFLLWPWYRVRDALIVTAYWTLDYFTDLLFWSLQLLSSMPASPSSHDVGHFNLAVKPETESSNSISLDTSSSTMTASASDAMDVTLVSPISEASDAADKKFISQELLENANPSWDFCSSSSSMTISMPSSPTTRRTNSLHLIISPPGSPRELDPHIDRHDPTHCLQSPFSEELRSGGASIDDFHATLMSAVSSELIEASSSFLREDLRIATHSPLNFRLSRELSPEHFPSPTFVTTSVPPSPRMTTGSPHRDRATHARRPGTNTRSSSMSTINHEDKENIAPTIESTSMQSETSPGSRRAPLRRGHLSFRSPRL
ncbi:hypothetical protein SCHPADRAFT_904077 [Schizopora paradoxa]|uniref:Uncharacterized protein n=1 Tax=Schizopora paradoxa TaxID=27342 RepID=A0A0H2RNQ6_9AGAM|nr:hypothetical protein SCHPADRAFT_904077 [Schizopora paradoxa]